MYKIYINETPISLTNESFYALSKQNTEDFLIAKYDGKVKNLFHYIDQCEKSSRLNGIVITHPDLDLLFNDFNSIYKRMDAAGGIITNTNNQILMMLRREMWDLPKGKIEKNESPEQAAIREVLEETGIVVSTKITHIHDSYHTYKLKDTRILKKTYWYKMQYESGSLNPQTEEDISLLEWANPKEVLKFENIYSNIKDVIHAYLHS